MDEKLKSVKEITKEKNHDNISVHSLIYGTRRFNE